MHYCEDFSITGLCQGALARPIESSSKNEVYLRRETLSVKLTALEDSA